MHTVKQILKAIENSGGIKTNVAKKLGVARQTIDRYQRLYPKIAKALEEEMSMVRDKAESNIFAGIQKGDIPISQWLLRYKGGYVEKTEQKVEGEVKTIIEVRYEDEKDK